MLIFPPDLVIWPTQRSAYGRLLRLLLSIIICIYLSQLSQLSSPIYLSKLNTPHPVSSCWSPIWKTLACWSLNTQHCDIQQSSCSSVINLFEWLQSPLLCGNNTRRLSDVVKAQKNNVHNFANKLIFCSNCEYAQIWIPLFFPRFYH